MDMYIKKKSVLPGFCDRDFYLIEEKTYWIKLCKIFLRRGQAAQDTVSYPPPLPV